MKLKEHIDILRNLHFPHERQLFQIAFNIINDHYNPIDRTLHDKDGIPTMTVYDFLKAIEAN